MKHKVHDEIPSGFGIASDSQVESFLETGSVNGAAKVALFTAERYYGESSLAYQLSDQAGDLDDDQLIWLAVRLRPPRAWDDVVSPVARLSAHVGDPDETLEWYIREYNNGFAAGRRGETLGSETSAAWDDGCCDARSGRPKWHLAYCAVHDCQEA